MNIKDYTYIVEIAQQRNLTAAANRLCITQSALTKFLQRIETELDTQLFYRRGKRLILTPIGQTYVEKGQEIIRLDQSLQDEIQKQKINGADTIRLGHGMGFAEFVLDCLLPEYYALPRTRSGSIHEDSSTSLLQAVEDGRLDLCLAYVREFRPALEYTPLCRTKLVLAVPTDSPLLLSGVPREGYAHPVVEGEQWLGGALHPHGLLHPIRRGGPGILLPPGKVAQQPAVRGKRPQRPGGGIQRAGKLYPG